MCKCISKINEKLKERGDELETVAPLLDDLSVCSEQVVIKTKKLNGKKGKPILLTASFCPFCGEKISE